MIVFVVILFHISCHNWRATWPLKTHFLKWEKSNEQSFNVQPKGSYQNLEKFPQNREGKLFKECSIHCAPMGRE